MKTSSMWTVLGGLALAGLIGACTCQGGVRSQLPTCAGPFEEELPAAGTRTITQGTDGVIVLPPASTDRSNRLAARVGGETLWRDIARALVSAVTGGERHASIYVVDPDGQERTVRLPLTARLTGPLFIPDDPADEIELIPNEHVIGIEATSGNAISIKHLGKTIRSEEVGPVLDTMLRERGRLYFLTGETPTREHQPVLIEPGPGVRLQHVLDVLSVVQTAGYRSTMVRLDG